MSIQRSWQLDCGRFQNAARTLLRGPVEPHLSCRSLIPLGIALFEIADVISTLESADSTAHSGLFSGDDELTANIYSRLRCVRDLCSASLYAAGWQWNANGSIDSEPKEVPRPEFEHWSEIIRRQAASTELNDVTEFCYFLDDLYDAALRITWEIEMMHEPTANVVWSEVFREIMHIRDHFDFAEMMILNCIKPAID